MSWAISIIKQNCLSLNLWMYQHPRLSLTEKERNIKLNDLTLIPIQKLESFLIYIFQFFDWFQLFTFQSKVPENVWKVQHCSKYCKMFKGTFDGHRKECAKYIQNRLHFRLKTSVEMCDCRKEEALECVLKDYKYLMF